MPCINVKLSAQYILAFLIFCFCACQNDKASQHQDALPHNLNRASNLDESEAKELANAEGKSVSLLTVNELIHVLSDSEAPTNVINFWKLDCEECVEMQQNLQSIQSLEGKEKLNLIVINLDPVSQLQEINLALRKSGVSSPVFQISDEPDWSSFNLTSGWEGDLPAFAIFTETETGGFYQQNFSENELRAILAPYLL